MSIAKGKERFIRESKQKSETVVFVGNGAVENGSSPLNQILSRWIDADAKLHPVVNKLRKLPSEPFHQLAVLSYKFKVFRGLQYSRWLNEKLKDPTSNPIQSTMLSSGLHRLINGFLELRGHIADAYQAQSSKLRWDSNIRNFIGPNAKFVTTNWDNSVWNEVSAENAVYIHGRCEHKESIIMPTELIIDETLYDFSDFDKELKNLASVDAAKYNVLFDCFRGDTVNDLLSAHDLASNWILGSKRIIIWGYSLGDYDGDVNALIGAAQASKDAELVVINPDSRAFERSIALTAITNATHYNPLTGMIVKL